MAAPFAALVLLSLAAQTGGERVPGWVTFDVANPRTLGGHRILHLEDVVGPRTRDDVPGLPAPKVVLIFTAAPSDCPGLKAERRGRDLCEDIARFATAKWAKGSLVVGLVLAEEESAGGARARLLRSDYPYPMSVDEHGLVRRALNADRPGVVLVVDSRLEGVRLSPPARMEGAARDRYLGEIRVALERALEREKEDER